MPISIHNKTYFPVAERLSMAHNDKEDALQSVVTDAVQVFEDGGVVFRAVVTFASGRTFTGHAYESPKSKGIAGQSPWEVAETSAVGRALGMGGYGSDDSIASADEVQRKAQPVAPRPAPPRPPVASPVKTTVQPTDTAPMRTDLAAIRKIAADKGIADATLINTIGRDYGVETLEELDEANAAILKARLEKAPAKKAA